MNFQGKVALVTGGACGIGFEIAKALLREGLKGLTIIDVNEEKGEESTDILKQVFGRDKILFVKTDITNEASFQDAFTKTIENFKRLDIVVNNAGVVNDRNYELAVDINVTGTTRGTLLAFKYLSADKGGSGGVVLNVSSVAGLDTCPPFPVYAATKHAIVSLVGSLGQPFHYKRSRVKIVALCPGATITPLGGTVTLGLDQDMIDELFKELADIPNQLPDSCGRAAVYIMKHAQSGSFWIVEGSNLYQVDYPARDSYSKFVKDLE